MTVQIVVAQVGLKVFYYDFEKGITASYDWKEIFEHEVFSVIAWRIVDMGSTKTHQIPLSAARNDYAECDSYALVFPDGHVETENPICAGKFPTFEAFYKSLLIHREKREIPA